jgi:hypothetical protein
MVTQVLLAMGIALALHSASLAAEPAAGSLDKAENGLWMRRRWLHDSPAAPEIEALVQGLRAHGIRRIYPFLGPMDREGWPGWRSKAGHIRYDPERAKAFLSAFHGLAPEIRVAPWTGGVAGRDIDLEDEKQRAGFAGHVKRIVLSGADGVHINIEPIPARTRGYLDLLREIKIALGQHRLSVAAYSPPVPGQLEGGLQWDLPFMREVCGIADEIVIMGYNTGAKTSAAYRNIVISWVGQLAAALPPPSAQGCEWLMGVPAYDDSDEDHMPDVETLENSLTAIAAGFATISRPSNFMGVAVYASFTMNDRKWAAFDRLWRGKPAEEGALAGIADAPD